MIRWTDLNDAGTDHGIGIDDLSVVARAAPTAASATLSGRVATANGRGISKAYVTISGGNLAVAASCHHKSVRLLHLPGPRGRADIHPFGQLEAFPLHAALADGKPCPGRRRDRLHRRTLK